MPSVSSLRSIDCHTRDYRFGLLAFSFYSPSNTCNFFKSGASSSPVTDPLHERGEFVQVPRNGESPRATGPVVLLDPRLVV
jgi:hypothetical protein